MKDIILNEVTKAAAILAGTAKIDDVKTAISLLVRYDVQAAGIDAETAKGHVEKVIKKLYPAVPSSRIDRLVEYYVAHATEFPLHTDESVPITQKEMDVVLSCNGIRAKCLMFALLALAKLDTMRFPKVDYWYNGQRWNELIKRANLTLSEDDMCFMLHDLREEGKIEFAKRIDNLSLHVLIADEVGEPALSLNEQDYRDLGYCLRAYLGEKYTRCEECGRWIKQKGRGRPTRFCADCAADNHRNVVAAYKKRLRN